MIGIRARAGGPIHSIAGGEGDGQDIVASTGEGMIRYGHGELLRLADIVDGSVKALEASALSPSLIPPDADAVRTRAGP